MVRRYTRNDASKYLIEKHGVRFSPNTLAKLFCIGGGPKCRHVGRRPFYDEPDLDEWIESRLRSRASSPKPSRTSRDGCRRAQDRRAHAITTRE
jgi:hypothetical protein